MSFVTFLYLVLLVLLWHVTPWLIRYAVLKVVPSVVGQVVREVKSSLASSKPES